METEDLYEMLVLFYQTAWCHITEDSDAKKFVFHLCLHAAFRSFEMYIILRAVLF
jgi:hypothetical protein